MSQTQLFQTFGTFFFFQGRNMALSVHHVKSRLFNCFSTLFCRYNRLCRSWYECTGYRHLARTGQLVLDRSPDTTHLVMAVCDGQVLGDPCIYITVVVLYTSVKIFLHKQVNNTLEKRVLTHLSRVLYHDSHRIIIDP